MKLFTMVGASEKVKSPGDSSLTKTNPIKKEEPQ
jgi:hypothetical protein